MLRHLGQPVEAGWFHGCFEVEAAGDGAVDDGLLLLGEDFDQPLLGNDKAVY